MHNFISASIFDFVYIPDKLSFQNLSKDLSSSITTYLPSKTLINYFFKNLFQLLIEYDTAGALFSDRILLPNLLDATVYTQSEDDR